MPRRKNSIDADVGAQVRALRIAADMTQESLGEALGLAFQQVQKYEKGANRMGASRIVEIARIFKVPITAIFGKYNSENGKSILVDARLDTKTRHSLIVTLDKLDNPAFEATLLNSWPNRVG